MENISNYDKPTFDDVRMAKESSRLLAQLAESNDEHVSVKLAQRGESHNINLPPMMLRVLLDALVQLSDGNAVTVIGRNAELSTVEAAAFLNVSRPFLIKLLESEKIPHRRVGTHRRVRFTDLYAYKSTDDKRRRKVLDKLAAKDQQSGLL